MKRVLTLSLLIVLVSGCSFPFLRDTGSTSYYVLEGKEEVPAETKGKQTNRDLLVALTAASPFLNGRKIVFSGDQAQRGYYQFAAWVESPAKRFTILLLRSLEKSGMFRSVSRLSGGSRGDLQLNTELLEFYHDVSDKEVVRVTLVAELVNLKSRNIIARREFTKEARTKESGALGAVKGFNKAVPELINDLLRWLSSVAVLPPPTVETGAPVESLDVPQVPSGTF